MATAYDIPVLPFAEPFADLPTQWLEASTRAMRASAELYTEVLSTQAEATRALLEAYTGLGAQAVQIGSERAAETTDRAAETTERTAETAARTTRAAAGETSRATKRATRRAASATRRTATPATPAAAAIAPISGYDDMTPDEIVAELREQPQAALAEIAAYEQAHEKRPTVLQQVVALTGPEPAPGYDALPADAAEELVTNGSAALAATVRDYERRHKDRASVIGAAVRRRADTDAS